MIPYEDFLKNIDAFYDGVWIFDSEDRFVYINDVVAADNGWSKEDVIGKKWMEVAANWPTWNPPLLPTIYSTKRPAAIQQISRLGRPVYTIGVPIFEEGSDGKIKYVVFCSRSNLNWQEFQQTQPATPAEEIQQTRELAWNLPDIAQVFRLIGQQKDTFSTCLFSGEKGVGKHALIQYMHSTSAMADKPLVHLDCSLYPEGNMEQVLFGDEDIEGAVVYAEGGYLLLDNIDQMNPATQERLDRFLEGKQLAGLPGGRMRKIQCKIVATTAMDLTRLAAAQRFSETLYKKLQLYTIYVPPLRERRNDVRALLFHYLRKYDHQQMKSHQFSRGCLNTLLNCEWSGNIPELRDLVENLVLRVNEQILSTRHLPDNLFLLNSDTESEKTDLSRETYEGLDRHLEEMEKQIVLEAYERFGTTRKVAERLQISQSKASRLIRKYLTP